MSIEEQYVHDPEGLKRDWECLLEPGYAGELGPDEFAYVKAALKKSPSLKRHWRLKPSAKRFPEKHIRTIARDDVLAK